MATLFDISLRQLSKLQSIDPVLDENFDEILTVIFYILDDDSKRILLQRNLNPKGIVYDESAKIFNFSSDINFDELARNLPDELNNPKLIRIIKRMQTFLGELTPPPLIKTIKKLAKMPMNLLRV